MAKKEVKEKNKKNTSYFKEMKAELKKVVWPTPKELLKNTFAVISFVLIIAIIVFILDVCFDNLNKYGITRLQEKVHSSFNTTESEGSDVDKNTENTEENNNNADADAVVKNNDEARTTTEESNTVETTVDSENTNSSENNYEGTVTE